MNIKEFALTSMIILSTFLVAIWEETIRRLNVSAISLLFLLIGCALAFFEVIRIYTTEDAQLSKRNLCLLFVFFLLAVLVEFSRILAK
jgi:hypothetical protein